MMKYIRTNCIAYHPVGTEKHDDAQRLVKAGEQVSIEYKHDYIKLFQGDLYIGFITDSELLVDNEEEIEYSKAELKYRTCTKCNKNIPLHRFDDQKGGRDGKTTICKACVSKHYTANRIRGNGKTWKQLGFKRFKRFETFETKDTI